MRHRWDGDRTVRLRAILFDDEVGVVAAKAERSWSAVVQEDILSPLGMDNTYTSVPEAHATGRLAAGFSARRGSPDRERLGLFDVDGIGPAAGMASSASAWNVGW